MQPVEPPTATAALDEASHILETFSSDNIPVLYERIKQEIIDSNPKLSSNRAGELAAARIFHNFVKAYAPIQEKVDTRVETFTPAEETLYNKVNVDEWNIKDQLVDLSKSRTLIYDAEDEPLARQPLPTESGAAESAPKLQPPSPPAQPTAAAPSLYGVEWNRDDKRITIRQDNKIVASMSAPSKAFGLQSLNKWFNKQGVDATDVPVVMRFTSGEDKAYRTTNTTIGQMMGEKAAPVAPTEVVPDVPDIEPTVAPVAESAPEPPASESLVPTPPEDATPTSLLDQDGVPTRMLTDEEKDAWQAGYNTAATGTGGRAYPTQNLEEAYRAGYDWHRESSTVRGDHRQALRDAVSKRLGVSGDTDIVDYIRKAVLDHARNNKPLPKGIYVVPTPMQAQKLADKLNTPLTALYIKDERDIHVGAWKSNLQGWGDWSGYVAEVPWDFSEWHRRDPAEKTNVYVVPAQTVASQVFTERPIPRYVIVPTQHTPGKDVPPMRAGARGGVRVEDWLEVKGIGGTAPKPPVPREYTGEPGIPIRYKPQKHLTGSGRYGLTQDGVTTHGGYDTWEEAVDAANRANRKAAETDRIAKEQERAERSKYPVLKWGKGEPDYIKLASRNEVGALRANLVGKIAQPYEHDSPVYLDKGRLVRIDNNEHQWNSGKYALHLVNPDDYGEHFQWSKHGERKAIAAGAYRKEALPSSPVTATPPVGEASSQPPTSPDAAAEDLMRSWKTERDQLVAKKYKNRGDEIRIERLTKMLAAKPEKWKPGDGVGHRVTRDQINRGFRIVEVDPAKKEVLIRQVADTGITVTGGDYDKIADQWVPIIDLVRDNRYNLRTPAPDLEPVAAPDAPKPTNLKSAYEQAIIRKGIIDLDNSPDGATQIRVVPLGDGYDVELHVKLPGQADIGAHRLSIVNDAPDILSTPTTLAGAQDKAVFLASSERARKNLIEKWREKHAPVASQETGVAMDTKPAGDADDVQDADPFDKLKGKPIEPVEMGWTDTASEPASADIPEGFDPVTLDQVKISGKPGKVTDGTGFTLEQKAHIADTLLKQRAPMTDAPLGKAAETGINRYAENRSETVKIEVPDDGTLRVVKSVEAIDTVLKKLGVKQSSEQNVRVPTILDKTEQWMILETPFGPAITDTKQLLPIGKEVYERLREGKARAAGYKGEVRDRGRELYDEVSALVSGNVEPLSVDRRVGSRLHGDELEAVVFKRGPEDEIHIAAKAFDHFVKQGAVKFESANGQVVIAKDGAGKILGVVSPYTYEAVSEGFGWTKQSEAEPTTPPPAPPSEVQGAPKRPKKQSVIPGNPTKVAPITRIELLRLMEHAGHSNSHGTPPKNNNRRRVQRQARRYSPPNSRGHGHCCSRNRAPHHKAGGFGEQSAGDTIPGRSDISQRFPRLAGE